jgi:hypothetical protein
MTEAEKARHAELTGTLHQVCPPLVDMVRDMIRTRSFRGAQRDTIVGALDALADVADELASLDQMVVEEGRQTVAATKERIATAREEQRRQQAAELAARRERTRRELEQAALRGGMV